MGRTVGRTARFGNDNVLYHSLCGLASSEFFSTLARNGGYGHAQLPEANFLVRVERKREARRSAMHLAS